MSNKFKNKKLKYKFTESKIPSQIMGGVFDPSMHDLRKIEQEIINGKNNNREQIRVLFISEASYLHTGFATYTREVLTRLNKNSKFVVAELGSYGATEKGDHRVKNIPWKYYHNLPVGQKEDQEYKLDYKDNQFGKWKLNYVLEDFKPDVILLHRDWWMDKFVLENPLVKKCHIIWMTCQDSYPSRWEWLKSYNNCDTMMAYCHFGKRVLEEQSRTNLAKMNGVLPIDVKYVCQAGAAPEFKPLDKNDLKTKMGIDPRIKFIGTVMRNQPRKLFTRIIESFALYLEKFPEASNNVYLLLHTGIPDVGFDIPESIHRYGVEDRVVFSCMCRACGHNGIAKWGFINQPCPVCKNSKIPGSDESALWTPNTVHGLDNVKFNEIYNLMDLYIQGSIAGADEMPVTEAKAAGVPVICSDYAAMYEKNRNGGGIPLKIATMYTECETMQNRCMFDVEDLAVKINKVISNPLYQQKLAKEARECAEKYYNWDLCAKKWEAAIMNADLKDRSVWEVPHINAIISILNEDKNIDRTIKSIRDHVDKLLIVGETQPDLSEFKDLNYEFINKIGSRVELEEFAINSSTAGWNFIIRPGEEFIANKTRLKYEAFVNNEISSEFIILTLIAKTNGIDWDEKVTQSRLKNKYKLDGDKKIVATNPKTVTTFAKYDSIMALTDERQKYEALKFTYCHMGESIINEIDKAGIIVRKDF